MPIKHTCTIRQVSCSPLQSNSVFVSVSINIYDTRLFIRVRMGLFAKHKTIKLRFVIYSQIYMKIRVAEFAWKLGYSVCKRLK